MQSQEEVQSICYQNVLDEADRRMSEHPEGGVCEDCANFRECKLSAIMPEKLAEEIGEKYGICVESDEAFPVEKREWHDWEECWCDPYDN